MWLCLPAASWIIARRKGPFVPALRFVSLCCFPYGKGSPLTCRARGLFGRRQGRLVQLNAALPDAALPSRRNAMKKDDIKKLVEQGIGELSDALAKGDSKRLEEFMAVMAKFPRYSFQNCMLIALQKPGARMVQGFHAWKKAGRWVKKGEKGIGIVAPLMYRNQEEAEDDDIRTLRGFKVVHVYDVSQTEGKELPCLPGVTGDVGHYIEAVERVIRAKGIELLYERIDSGADGLSCKGKIIVDPKVEDAERFAVLTHELAHLCSQHFYVAPANPMLASMSISALMST